MSYKDENITLVATVFFIIIVGFIIHLMVHDENSTKKGVPRMKNPPKPPHMEKSTIVARINILQDEIANLKKIVQSANFDKNLPVNFLDACIETGKDMEWFQGARVNKRISRDEYNYFQMKTIFDALNKVDGEFMPNWSDLKPDKWIPFWTCSGIVPLKVQARDRAYTHPTWMGFKSKETCEHFIKHFSNWYEEFEI